MLRPPPPIRRVRIDGDLRAARELLANDFPTLVVEPPAVHAADTGPVIDAEAWRAATRFHAFDDALERSRADAITISGSAAPTVAFEALTRWQRFVDRRNDASRGPLFDAVLDAHRVLHDVSKPLVKADHDHALDTWQWMLRLDPNAGLAAQLAALFHDVERLESEADVRVEQHAPDYQTFKDAHARRGADIARETLLAVGVDESTIIRVCRIIAAHERRGHDADVDLVNDADALSFFSLNSPGYIDYFGPEQTRRKVRYTLGRLGPAARSRLAGVRLCPDVRALLVDAEAA